MSSSKVVLETNEETPLAISETTATEEASGECGTGVTWSLDTEGVLTISGNGEITGTPWSDYSDSIKSIVIEDGVTSICDNAFDSCTNLTSITIPKTVTSIGDGAFYGCDSLTEVNYGGANSNWNSITIGSDNENLTGATINCLTCEKHKEKLVTVKATCTESGYKAYVCSECGNTRVISETAALGHRFIRYYTNDDGTREGVCTRCGQTITLPAEVKVNIKKCIAWVKETDTFTLETNVTPASAPLTWTSSDESIATVDENGVVTALSRGRVTITATAEDGTSDSCKVTVWTKYHKISKTSGKGGIISSLCLVKHHDSVTIKVKPLSSYTVDTVTVNGEPVTIVNNQITIDDVTSDINVEATFKAVD